jgi:hypothetical protein
MSLHVEFPPRSFRRRISMASASLILLLAVAACGGGSHGGDHAGVEGTPASRPAAGAPLSADEMKQAMASGLAVWRQQRLDVNGVNKGACANCHSADGIELAIWNFDNADVVRRAHLDGVSTADQAKLVTFFRAMRQKYRIVALRDIQKDHPFQPGGTWYTGTSDERDLAFANGSFTQVAPTLMGARIATLADARKAIQELRASNPLKMKVGIEMPQISRDCVRPGECSLNDWMSDLPRFPKPEMEAQWFALNDAYIANPTDENLRGLLLAVDTLTTPWLQPGETRAGPAGTLGTTKFKSMQVLQHFLRREQLGLFSPADDVNPIASINGPGLERANFPFLVGDFAFDKTDQKLVAPGSLPVFVRNSLGESAANPLTDEAVAGQKAVLRTPWWWAGFMFDPALSTGTNSEYFVGNLTNPYDNEGFAFHQLYAGARHAVDPGYRAVRGVDNDATRLPEGLGIGGSADSAMLFATADARLLYRKAAVNWVRMHLILLQDQLSRFGPSALAADDVQDSGYVCNSDGGKGLPAAVATAAAFDGAGAAFVFDHYAQVRALAGCAATAHPGAYAAGTGTGMTVQWFASIDLNSRAASSPLGKRVEPTLAMPRQDVERGYFRDYLATIGVAGNAGSRTTGTLQAPVSGDYVFGEGSLSQARMWVNGQLVYSSEEPTSSAGGYAVNPGVTVHLDAGQKVAFLLERYNVAFNGMNVGWGTADGALSMNLVPTSQMSPQ